MNLLPDPTPEEEVHDLGRKLTTTVVTHSGAQSEDERLVHNYFERAHHAARKEGKKKPNRSRITIHAFATWLKGKGFKFEKVDRGIHD